MLSLAGALIAGGVLAMLFTGTRWLGILCLVAACYLFPVFSAFLIVLIVSHLLK